MLSHSSTRSKESGFRKSSNPQSSSISSTFAHSRSESSQLDGLTFQILGKEKKLQALLTEYEQLVSAAQFETKDSESAELLIQLGKRESLIYQEETQHEVYKHVLDRTKRSNDSMKAKVKHLQRIRDRTVILYKEADESSTEAVKINNLESAKIQHLESFIGESRDVRSQGLTGKLEEIKQIAHENSARNAKKTDHAESSLAKMRTQELQKRIIYFNRQKESTSIMRADLIKQRKDYRFKLNKLFRNLGSTNVEECIDRYFEVISRHTSMCLRTDELLAQLNSLLTQEKKLRKSLVAYRMFIYIPTDQDCAKTNEKLDLIFKPQYDKCRSLQAELYNREIALKKLIDTILKICMIISVLVQRVEDLDKYDVLGPKNRSRLPTHIKSTKDEHLTGILDSIFKLTPNAIMIALLLEKKLVSVMNYLGVYYRTHRGAACQMIANSAGHLFLCSKKRTMRKRPTILDAFNVDLSAKNVEVIKKNIYNTHFIDTETSSYTNTIYDMITGAAQLAEDYRKTFEKQPKKVDLVKLDFAYEEADDETLIRNKELAVLYENSQEITSSKPGSRKTDKETIIEKRKKKAMDLGKLLSSKSSNEIPVLPYIHRSVKNLAAKTNRLRMVSNSESLSSLCQDISKMKNDLYKISIKSPLKESLAKFPKIQAVSRSEISSPASIGMKTHSSSKMFIKKGK